MIFVELRPLILVLIAMVLIYAFYRIAKKIVRTENTKEAIEDKKESIKETVEFAKQIPKVNEGFVKSAQQKIKDFLK